MVTLPVTPNPQTTPISLVCVAFDILIVVGERRDFKFVVQVDGSLWATNCPCKGRGTQWLRSRLQDRDSYNGRLIGIRKSCMAYRIAGFPVTLSEAEGQFCCLNLCNTRNSGNACFYRSTLC